MKLEGSSTFSYISHCGDNRPSSGARHAVEPCVRCSLPICLTAEMQPFKRVPPIGGPANLAARTLERSDSVVTRHPASPAPYLTGDPTRRRGDCRKPDGRFHYDVLERVQPPVQLRRASCTSAMCEVGTQNIGYRTERRRSRRQQLGQAYTAWLL